MTLIGSKGEFNLEKSVDPCRNCSGGNVMRRTWESSDGEYKDHKYICQDCGHVWWNRKAVEKD